MYCIVYYNVAHEACCLAHSHVHSMLYGKPCYTCKYMHMYINNFIINIYLTSMLLHFKALLKSLDNTLLRLD